MDAWDTLTVRRHPGGKRPEWPKRAARSSDSASYGFFLGPPRHPARLTSHPRQQRQRRRRLDGRQEQQRAADGAVAWPTREDIFALASPSRLPSKSARLVWWFLLLESNPQCDLTTQSGRLALYEVARDGLDDGLLSAVADNYLRRSTGFPRSPMPSSPSATSSSSSSKPVAGSVAPAPMSPVGSLPPSSSGSLRVPPTAPLLQSLAPRVAEPSAQSSVHGSRVDSPVQRRAQGAWSSSFFTLSSVLSVEIVPSSPAAEVTALVSSG